jgi:threonylcarbamoyladenosine tRNA methylthiotransferase MtaB
MSGPETLTFGCRLNACESETIRARAREAGLDEVVIVNTCAVTAEAVRQARQAIRRARRERPGRPIVVTGCAAQIAPDRFAAMAEVDLVLGNHEKLDLAPYRDFAAGRAARVQVADIFAVRETAAHLVDGFEERARAFVQVQNGCDHRCTFCIIPYGRGASRSVPATDVVDQVRRLAEAGFNEVVLTGVDLTAWGGDLPDTPPLGDLVGEILRRVPELPRLRLSSLDAVEIDRRLFCLIA